MTKKIICEQMLLEIQKAIRPSTQAKRRSAMRAVLGRIADSAGCVGLTRHTLIEIIADSPMVGSKDNQIKIRPAFSALRDCLSYATVMAMLYETFKSYPGSRTHDLATCTHPMNPDEWGFDLKEAWKGVMGDFSQAVILPSACGVVSPRGKTGFIIGYNKRWLKTQTVKHRAEKQRQWLLAQRIPCGFLDREILVKEDGDEALVAVPLSTGLDIVTGYLATKWADDGTIFGEVRSHDDGGAMEVWKSAVSHCGIVENWDDTTISAVMTAIFAREKAKPTVMSEVPLSTEADVKSALARIHGDAGTLEDAEAKAGAPKFNIEGPLKSSLEGLLDAATGGTLKDMASLQKMLNEGVEAKDKAKKLEEQVARAVRPASTRVVAKPGEELPDGDVKYDKAYNVLGMRKRGSMDFDVPVFEWKTPHPMVPEIDPDYIFRPEPTLKALIGLVKGINTYAVGHTGTGKTTLFLQLASRMNWPVIRINFDSEITRLDLIGRDILKADSATGVTVSEFVEGVLPTAIAGPFILLCDEVDRVRPEVSYVFQRVLEDQGIMLNEDGGRLVSPHDWHRVVATANTVGQGDEFGLYQGARHQSQAFLDRFTNWIEMGYLGKKDETKLLKSKAPGIDDSGTEAIMNYVAEHRSAFVNAEILQPISARAIEQLGMQYVSYRSLLPDSAKALKMAFDSVVLVRGSATDRAVMTGLLDRVTKGESE
jgi:cobaltochelatase CobS